MISQRIRGARRVAGLSQQALADQLGVTRGAVSNWESAGNIRPSTDKLVGMASVLKVSFEWLATGRGTMTLTLQGEEMHSGGSTTVVCPYELHLLHAYRRAPEQVKRLLQELAVLRVVPMPRGRMFRSAS